MRQNLDQFEAVAAVGVSLLFSYRRSKDDRLLVVIRYSCTNLALKAHIESKQHIILEGKSVLMDI